MIVKIMYYSTIKANPKRQARVPMAVAVSDILKKLSHTKTIFQEYGGRICADRETRIAIPKFLLFIKYKIKIRPWYCYSLAIFRDHSFFLIRSIDTLCFSFN